jgi:hypothetical protein
LSSNFFTFTFTFFQIHFFIITFWYHRPAGVVRGIGMTQDVRGETIENIVRVSVGSFSNFGLPSTKSGKTNGVLVEGDFATSFTYSFLERLRNYPITKKIFF